VPCKHQYYSELTIPTIERLTRNYEILIRFNDDNRIGAHLQTLTGYAEDGTYVQPPQLDAPNQLTLEELKRFVADLKEEDWFVSSSAQPTGE